MRTDELRAQLEKLPIVEKIYSAEKLYISDRNIGIYVHTLEEGGSQRAVEFLVNKLIDRGYGVCVFSPIDGKYADIYSDRCKALVVRMDDSIGLYGDDRTVIRSFEAVFINSMLSYRYLLYYINTDIPCYMWIHEGEKVIRHYLKATDPIIYGSENITYAFPWKAPMRLWEEMFPKSKTAYLPIEVSDVQLQPERRVQNSEIRFFFPGAYVIHKGFHVAVQSLILLEAGGAKDFKAYFCGYECESEYYRKLKEICDGHENITLLGELNKEEMEEQLCLADCVVTPSILDAGPLTAVEALSHEKLLVISDATGVSEYIKDCVNGFVFQSENVQELYKRLLLVYHDVKGLGEISRRGRAVYEQFFTAKAMDEALEQLLER